MGTEVESRNQDKSENLLYHYTDQKGLLGILESTKIRATHYRFLNDFSECQEARGRLRAINERLAAYGGKSNPEGVRKIRKLVYDQWNGYMDKFFRLFDTYVVSFTDDDEYFAAFRDYDPTERAPGDRLSLWRGYAQGRQGFSLGFERTQLKKNAEGLSNTKRTPIELYKCDYLGLLKEAKLGGIAAIPLSTGQMHDLCQIKDLQQLGELQARLLALSSTLKHPGFREEHEWRLVFHMLAAYPDQELIKFREGKFGITPYIEIPLGITTHGTPLRRIVVGPTANKDEAVKGLQALLEGKGVKVKTGNSPDGVEVVPSGIPYRD